MTIRWTVELVVETPEHCGAFNVAQAVAQAARTAGLGVVSTNVRPDTPHQPSWPQDKAQDNA